MKPRQFELWRLFASVLWFAVAFALARAALHSGGAIYPVLAVVFLSAAIGTLFQRGFHAVHLLFSGVWALAVVACCVVLVLVTILMIVAAWWPNH